VTAAEQIVRSRQRCEAAGVAPGPCANPLGLPYQVHKLKRGSFYRRIMREYPEACLLVCPGHHEWITNHTPAAVDLGLAWDDAQARAFLQRKGRMKRIGLHPTH